MESRMLKKYIVLYFDMLGFRGNILTPLRNANGVIDDKVMSNIKKYSAAALMFLENARKLYYAVVNERDKSFAKILSICKHDDEILGRKIDMGIQQFSDTSMIYIEDVGELSWIIVQQMLMQLSQYIIELMTHDIYVRGCLAEGDGWEIEHNCLLGPVIDECYTVEQKIAGYQRIVATDEFEKRLAEVLRNLDVNGGQYWRSVFTRDYDGLLIFDYIKAHTKDWNISCEDITRRIDGYIANVKDVYLSYIEKKNSVVADKYYHLLDYLRRASR